MCVIEWDVPAPNWAGARTGGNLSVLDAPSPSVLDGAVGSAAREDALSSDGLSKNFRPGSRSNSRGETLDQACRLTDALRIFRRQILYLCRSFLPSGRKRRSARARACGSG